MSAAEPGDPGQRPPREAGTRAILDTLLDGDHAQTLDFNALLSGLGRRAFGMLLFVAVLPAFIPIPIGGAIAGPLVVLAGFAAVFTGVAAWALHRDLLGR